MTIYWLDDNSARIQESKNISEALNASVIFFDLYNKNLEEELASIAQKKEPDVILLDQNLENATTGTFKKGSTAAAFLKENWPDCPIICVTGENIEEFSNYQRYSYEEVLPINKISEYYEIIESIATSFKNLKRDPPKVISDITTKLKAPERDYEKIQSVLPTFLKEDFDERGLISELSYWVRNVLIKRPGFLYDELWLATYLGIKIESFFKVKPLFDKAKYQGVFATDSNPRWWKTLATEILYEYSQLEGLPWESGRGLPNVQSTDYSECYISREPFPETVAFTETTRDSQRFPMKLKYTISHPEFESLLHFENLRLMKPAE